MNMAKYCRSKNMDLQEYKNFKTNIENTAIAILDNIRKLHKIDTGIYHSITEILHYNGNEIQGFLIMELKKLGVEFINNNELYRY